MTTQERAAMIKRLAGSTIFRVTFIKRSDNSKRRMVCRLKCTKGINSEGPRYDAKDKGLLPVFDTQADGWRCIPLEKLLNARIRGVEYQFDSVE